MVAVSFMETCKSLDLEGQAVHGDLGAASLDSYKATFQVTAQRGCGVSCSGDIQTPLDVTVCSPLWESCFSRGWAGGAL